MKKLLNISPLAAILLAMLAAAGALTTAYVSQYGFGFAPCELCHWQRWPLWAALGLGLVLLFAGRRFATLGLVLMTLLFLGEAGIAIFHIGVENYWWLGTEACTAAAPAGTDAASLREQLLGTPVARCDQVTWKFLGLSMATWNIPFSLAVAAVLIYALVRNAKSKN